ncbi:MAG: hypothetical protein AAFZ09_19205, partial [Pseudomonadota bacterium]
GLLLGREAERVAEFEDVERTGEVVALSGNSEAHAAPGEVALDLAVGDAATKLPPGHAVRRCLDTPWHALPEPIALAIGFHPGLAARWERPLRPVVVRRLSCATGGATGGAPGETPGGER